MYVCLTLEYKPHNFSQILGLKGGLWQHIYITRPSLFEVSKWMIWGTESDPLVVLQSNWLFACIYKPTIPIDMKFPFLCKIALQWCLWPENVREIFVP